MSHKPDYQQIKHRVSRQIRVGNVLVGGDAPISVQSMTNTETTDVAAYPFAGVLLQIRRRFTGIEVCQPESSTFTRHISPILRLRRP
jgi:hypothetical protein